MDGIKIRKYREDDYEQVVRIFENGINETHLNYLEKFYNGKYPNLIALEILYFTLGYFLGNYGNDKSSVAPILSGTLFVAIFCVLSFWMRWRWNKIYIRKVMKNELKDKKLEFCTSSPNAFFIAADERHNDKVVGIVGCEKLDSYACELNRLTVLPNARKLGIGKMLVVKVMDYARAIGCIKIKLTTYKSMNAAMHLYQRLGFHIVKEVNPGVPLLSFNDRYTLKVRHVLPLIGEKEYDMVLNL